MSKGPEPYAHPDSLWAQYVNDGDMRFHITRMMREADIDLALKNRWAANGFVSRPGNFGPSEEEKDEV